VTTEVDLNGQSLGSVSLGDTVNPWGLYVASFPLPKALDRVQIWSHVTSQTVAGLQPKSQGTVKTIHNQPPVRVRLKGAEAKHPHSHLVTTAAHTPGSATASLAHTAPKGGGTAGHGRPRASSRGLLDLVAAAKIRT
jgi:hypothetical protein